MRDMSNEVYWGWGKGTGGRRSRKGRREGPIESRRACCGATCAPATRGCEVGDFSGLSTRLTTERREPDDERRQDPACRV